MYVFEQQNVVRSERAYCPRFFEILSETRKKTWKNDIFDLFWPFWPFLCMIWLNSFYITDQRCFWDISTGYCWQRPITFRVIVRNGQKSHFWPVFDTFLTFLCIFRNNKVPRDTLVVRPVSLIYYTSKCVDSFRRRSDITRKMTIFDLFLACFDPFYDILTQFSHGFG